MKIFPDYTKHTTKCLFMANHSKKIISPIRTYITFTTCKIKLKEVRIIDNVLNMQDEGF